MANAAVLAEKYGYDEININCGCPSHKVMDGYTIYIFIYIYIYRNFGACLMLDAELVGEIARKMRQNVQIPVSVKCRLGVDDLDSYEDVANFIRVVSTQGEINHFIVHARKAFLKVRGSYLYIIYI